MRKSGRSGASQVEPSGILPEKVCLVSGLSRASDRLSLSLALHRSQGWAYLSKGVFYSCTLYLSTQVAMTQSQGQHTPMLTLHERIFHVSFGSCR